MKIGLAVDSAVRRRARAPIIAATVIGLTSLHSFALSVATAGPPEVGVRVGVEDRHHLQELLDRHRVLLLDAGGDYRTPTGAPLRVSSNQKIVAGWNTRLPPIEIPGGVSDVSLLGLSGDVGSAPTVIFSGGKPNSDIEIVGSSSGPGTLPRIRLASSSRVSRLTVTAFGGLDVQQAQTGYVRDSMFIGMHGYRPGPLITWHGNAREPSERNAFLGLSAITPERGARWDTVGELWLAGWDCESWNESGRGWPTCFTIDGARRIVSIRLTGGTASPKNAGAEIRYANVDTLLTWFDQPRGGDRDGADALLERVNTRVELQSPGASRWLDVGPVATSHISPMAGAAVAASDRAFTALLAGTAFPSARRLPMLRRWRADVPRDGFSAEGGGDDAGRIQADIDAHGIARLAPGTYRLSRPLRIGSLRRTEGIVGDDAESVVLVARGLFPVIEGRGYGGDEAGRHPGAMQTLVLSGLTLLGGTHGIRWSGEAGNIGPGGLVAWSTFENLRFAQQATAAVEARGIFGLDSNLWRHVDFYDMPVAFRGVGQGSGAGMTYADKQLFVDTQYRDVRDVVWFWTSDRPSGGEIWANGYFSDVGQVTRTHGATNLMWVNSVMEDVRGSKGIEITDRGPTESNYFYQFQCVWRGRGPAIVTDTQTYGIGTLFVESLFEQQGGSIVSSDAGQGLSSWRTKIAATVRPGRVSNGIFIQSAWGPATADWTFIRDGVAIGRAGGHLR